MHLTALTLLCLCLASQALGFYPGRGMGFRRRYNPYSRFNRIRGPVRQATKQVKPVHLPAKPKQAVATAAAPSAAPTGAPPARPQVEPIHMTAPSPAFSRAQGRSQGLQSVNTPFDPVFQPFEPTFDPSNLPYDPMYDQTYDYLPFDLASRGVGNADVIYVIKEDHPLPQGSSSFNNRQQSMSASAHNSPIEQQILDIVGQFQQQLPTQNNQAQFQGFPADQSVGNNFASMPAQNQAPASPASRAQSIQMQTQASPSAAPASSSTQAQSDPTLYPAAPASPAAPAAPAVPAAPAATDAADATAAPSPAAPAAPAPVDHFDSMMRQQFMSEMDLPPHMSAQMMNSANMDPYFQMQLAEAMDFPNHPALFAGFGPADATGMNGSPAASPASASAPASSAPSATPTNNAAAPATPTDAPASANGASSFDAAFDRALSMGMAEAMDLPGFMHPGDGMGIF